MNDLPKYMKRATVKQVSEYRALSGRVRGLVGSCAHAEDRESAERAANSLRRALSDLSSFQSEFLRRAA